MRLHTPMPAKLTARAPAAVVMDATSLVAPPPAGFEGAIAAGEKKAAMAPSKIFLLSVLSGCHVRQRHGPDSLAHADSSRQRR